ncbi:MAG TPA: hypothetical protein VIV14_01505 [Gammaproteobacteria bacterium]
MRQLLYLSIGLSLIAGTARAQIEAVFNPTGPGVEYAARMYREIWAEHGEQIIAALEARSCLPFDEPVVEAIVAERTSNSGGPEHPMTLRASYVRDVKQATLVHELGHRHLWKLEERIDDVDGHQTLFLVLDRVWADLWGEDFAAAAVANETEWHERYEEAWAWARSLTENQRERLWDELLSLNGFASCDGPLERSAGGRTDGDSVADR